MLSLSLFGTACLFWFGLFSLEVQWVFSGVKSFKGLEWVVENKERIEAGFCGSQCCVITHHLSSQHSHVPQSPAGRAVRIPGGRGDICGVLCVPVWVSHCEKSTESPHVTAALGSSQGRSVCPRHVCIPFLFLPLSRQTNMFCVNTHHNRLASSKPPKQITDKIPLST